MSRKIFLRTPKIMTTTLRANIVLSVLFLFFGVFLLFAAEGEARPFAAVFGIIWVIACLSILLQSLRAYRAVTSSDSFEAGELTEGDKPDDTAWAAKLRELECLKNEKLITEEEYRKKRSQILEEKW